MYQLPSEKVSRLTQSIQKLKHEIFIDDLSETTMIHPRLLKCCGRATEFVNGKHLYNCTFCDIETETIENARLIAYRTLLNDLEEDLKRFSNNVSNIVL